MSEPVGITPQQLSDAEGILRGQMPAAAELQGQANDEGLDMMAWGVPGLFISPGYYQMVGDLRELFRMMNEGLEGHANRLKECREEWDTADMEMAKEFSQFDPAGLGDSIQGGGSTWTNDGDRYHGPGSVGLVDSDAWKASGVKAVMGGKDVYEKILAVGKADDAGEGLNAVMDLTATAMGWGWDMIDAALNPLSFLISSGLDFLISLIQPLDDLMGMVTGNGERMAAEIERWGGIKDGLPPIGDAVKAIPEGGLSEWSGTDGDLAREKIKDFAESVYKLGDQIQVLQGLMQLCELIATCIRKTILSLISDWITNRIIDWAVATPLAVPTAGASTAAAMVRSVISSIRTVVTALNRYSKVANTFVEANRILMRVKQVFEIAAKPLAEAGFKSVGMIGTLAGSGGPSTSDIADGFNG
ncbi:hypothetical protein [Glycomyces paridis]|uniref:WXG100 family type VII secretion target n=1 Tax=Glycomyces paridis TaxID=2126555 RepID=A0A4S8PN97_9ACTN|nr:hypothetical protein [Glycomyces paridis]THV30109.1 hypothetical protein E9998_06945 [Glycomyces paridis]